MATRSLFKVAPLLLLIFVFNICWAFSGCGAEGDLQACLQDPICSRASGSS
jgi:hypothetical protein